MILYFLRHGLAEDRLVWSGDDGLRPLTKQGIKLLEREADVLMPLLSDLKLILTSPLTRAFQTAEIVAKKLSLTNNLIKDQRLSPGFDTTQLVAVLDDYPDQDLMMLVGHEPDFSLTISSIIGGGNLVCKKGGLARVDLYSRSPLTGELVWLVPPKIIIG